jgi:hypothetical protein
MPTDAFSFQLFTYLSLPYFVYRDMADRVFKESAGASAIQNARDNIESLK